MFGVRRSGSKVTNQVCLNHFVISSALTFPQEYRSPFSAWLWARMFPLAAPDELAKRFYSDNDWVEGYFPNLGERQKAEGKRQKAKGKERKRTWVGDSIEAALGRYQLQRIAKHPLTHAGSGRVVANDRMMIFHPSLPEEEVMERFTERRAAS
jgi:hypothetical protein